MPTEEEVHAFLQQFHARMKIWNVLFRDDRTKNAQALSVLGIVANNRKAVLEQLTTQDFSEGPMKDGLNSGPDLWVFGKEVKEHEVVFCISFHPSEHPMEFPFKRTTP